MSRRIALLLAAISAVLLVGALSLRFFIRTYRVPTGAMAPTVPIGSHLVVRLGGTVERGSIAAFRFPVDARYSFVMRIVAAGGDVVEIRDKRLFVNGREPDEPYAVHADQMTYPGQEALTEPFRSRDQFGPYRVPPGHYFVLGDDRDRSSDSRYWGTVPRENIIGPVIAAYSWRRVWRP